MTFQKLDDSNSHRAPASTSIKNRPKLRVLASRSYIFPGGRIQLSADLVSHSQKQTAVFPQWSIQPPTKGISIDQEGNLTASTDIKSEKDSVIRVVAVYKDRTAEKPVRLVKKDPLPPGVLIHYSRHDGNYDGWNIWKWKQGKDGSETSFSERTDFGVLASVDSDYVIIRYLDWFAKETGDLSMKDEKELFIVQGDPTIYRSFRKALSASGPRILAAVMDRKDQVRAFLTGEPAPNTRFDLYMNDIRLSTAYSSGKQLKFDISRPYEFDPSALYRIEADRMFGTGMVTPRHVLDTYYYDGDDLGATYGKDAITLKLWAPTASEVHAVLYSSADEPEGTGRAVKMKKDSDEHGIWSLQLDKASNYGLFYKYRLDFYQNTPFHKTTYGVDPYASALSVNGRMGALTDPDSDPETIPPLWNEDVRPVLKTPEDSIIYELHVRDFSMDPNSGIEKKDRGKYTAFTRENTVHPKDPSIRTGIDHLSELGITHLHLMPVYDFATVDESKPDHPGFPQYNWGYDPKNYNAPEGSYSTNPYVPAVRILEFRKMVQTLHKRGIRVVMDVVYNHTYDTSVFDPIVPGYYYRTDNLGRPTNGSGCGNEIASERPMVRKYIIDSLRRWAVRYRVDGFRFDLMGIIDRETMKQVSAELKKIDPTILIYGEPWGGGPSSLSPHLQVFKGSQKKMGFSVFNDNFRNAIRGDNNVSRPSAAYVTGGHSNREEIKKGVIGAIGDFTDAPGEVINYAACHDNYILWDQITAALGFCHVKDGACLGEYHVSAPGAEFEDPVKRHLFAYGILMTSQGIPFIAAGDEMLRTKFGDHNSYKSPDSINMIRWDYKRRNMNVFRYFQGLVALRREHPAFRMKTPEQISRHFRFLEMPNNLTGFILKDNANNDSWKTILVFYNPETVPYLLKAPEGGPWTVAVNDRQAGTKPVEEGYRSFSENIIVPPLSVMVLYSNR